MKRHDLSGKKDYSDGPCSILKVEADHAYDEGISSDNSDSDDEGYHPTRVHLDSISEKDKISDVYSVFSHDIARSDSKSCRYSGRSASDETTDESSGGREVRSIIGKESTPRKRSKDK